MESKFDWLTLTIRPSDQTIDYDMFLGRLGNGLLLNELMAKMTPRGGGLFYDWTMTYENITLYGCTPERIYTQGFCLQMSSQGLDYFNRYLAKYRLDLRTWLYEWRALCFQGYITCCTRVDYAMDDIHYNNEKPFITLKKVSDCYRKGEMSKKSRVVDFIDGAVTLNERLKNVDSVPVVGRTLNIGSRKSNVFCRFYDKLAEQLQKKEPLPENCTSWTRCEFEFKGSAAMSVLNSFLDRDDVDFGKYMRGVVNNYCSFIVRNNKNISRCPVKRWWAKFLGGCTEKFKLPHKAPARSAYARAKRFIAQCAATLYTCSVELGAIGVYKIVKNSINEKRLKNPKYNCYKKELAENIKDNNVDYEFLNGFKRYSYCSSDDEQKLKNEIERQHLVYRQAFNTVRLYLDDFDFTTKEFFTPGVTFLGGDDC